MKAELELADLLKLKLNEKGELHLDAIQAKMVIDHINYIYKYVDNQNLNIQTLINTVSHALGITKDELKREEEKYENNK